MYSLPRRWSSWIPNFSRWLTWLKPTGSNGRSLIRRDNTTTARLCRRAPAALLRAQKPAAAPWPRQAARPAAATTHHLHTLVSFWRSSVLLFLPPSPLRWGLPWQCMQRFPGCSAATAGFSDLSAATSDEFSRAFQPPVTERCSACLSTITDQPTPSDGKLKALCQRVNH